MPNLLIDKTYFFNNIQARRLLVQYMQAVIYYEIGYNILNVINQLFFTYYSIALELRLFILLPIKAINASDYIYMFEKKQKI